MKAIIYLFFITTLSGCATGYGITYNTEPTGASIICGGTNYGYSPVTLNYEPNENHKAAGKMSTTPCAAIWSSGARGNFQTTSDLNRFPNGVVYTLPRPNVEGYSQDANFALQVQNMQNQKRQADAAESAANNAAWEELGAELEAKRERRKTTTCINMGDIITCN